MFGKINPPQALIIPLRVGAGLSPAVAASLFVKAMAPFFVLVSIALMYACLSPLQGRLFEFSPKEKHWAITLPVHVLFLAWAFALAVFDHYDQIGRTAGPMVIIVAVCIWPVYMGQTAYARKRRQVPFKTSFAMAAIIVVIQQILIFGRRF
jgi:hypothetical protein